MIIPSSIDADALRSDASDYLEHHGIKGMKWGVRNAETLRKYGIAVRKQAVKMAASAKAKGAATAASARKGVSAAKKKAGDFANETKAKAKGFKDAKIAERKQSIEESKKLGMKRKEYDELRETTLKSHDPRVVAKGMHTLTDKELTDKINRLRKEDDIAKLATSAATRESKIKKEKYEAIKNHPLYDIGSKVAKDTLKTLAYDTVVMQGVQPVLSQRVQHAAKKAQESFDRKNGKAEPNDSPEVPKQNAKNNVGASKNQNGSSPEAPKSSAKSQSSTSGNSESSSSSPSPKNTYSGKNQAPFTRKEPSIVDGKKDAAHQTQSERSKSTKYTQRTRKPETYANNAASSSPGIFEAKVVSSSSRQSQKAASSVRSSSVYSSTVSSTTAIQKRGQSALRSLALPAGR